jgi:hypothetical protein
MPFSLISGGLAAAARFTPLGWRRVWAGIVLTTLLLGLALRPPPSLATAEWLVAALIAMLVSRGALWRLALEAGRPGPGGLQVGAIEGRLAAVWGLSALFMAVLAALLFVAMLIFAYAAASAGQGFDPDNVVTWAPAVDEKGRILVSVAALAGVGAMAWASAHIALGEAASVALGKVQVLSTWGLARRRVMVILVANLLLAVPPAAAFLATPKPHEGLIGAIWPWLESLVVTGLWLPMGVGLMAYVWQTRAAQ